jgi:glyoxylase-like metal-dependent hydrolase (beta-lactamase superfamily II)
VFFVSYPGSRYNAFIPLPIISGELMKKISAGVYIENSYPGVTLGVLVFPDGVVMIDAPINPDDGRAWQKDIRELKGGMMRLLINLDSHPDRTLGARFANGDVLAHTDTAKVFTNRSSIFKAQIVESGAEWENCSGLSGIRWLPPNLTFTEQAKVYMDATEILVEHHPGPEEGASWVILPEKKMVFVGDAVLAKQPPFLADAKLESWVEALDLLLSKEYKGYKIVSGRGGLVGEKEVRNVRRFLKNVEKQLERLSKRKATPQATEKLVDKLLAQVESPAKYRKIYSQRLHYGLYHCFAKNYSSSSNKYTPMTNA